MSQFESIVASLKKEKYETKKQLLGYTLQVVQSIVNSKRTLDKEDSECLLEYAYGEVDALLAIIPNTASYKEKDVLFECEDSLLGIIFYLHPKMPEDVVAKIKQLVELVAKERYIETYINDIFQQETIEKADIEQLISLASKTADEYQKGKMFAGLVHYAKDIIKMTDDGKQVIADYIASEIERYLSEKSLSDDCITNLELVCDIAKLFYSEAVISLLYDVMKLSYSNVNFYLTETLFSLNREVPEDVVIALLKDMEYANLVYGILEKYGKTALAPKEYTSPEYLAKSDMNHWLTYPTELGKAPDEIEYIGKITYLFKKEEYFVFKYRSDSETLDDELKNTWLIGWSSDEGGTFSNFDRYDLFEKSTVKATLNNIKRKLIG